MPTAYSRMTGIPNAGEQRQGRPPLAPYRFAAKAANRIPGARLVTIERGGHFFMGHDAEVGEAVRAVVHEVT